MKRTVVGLAALCCCLSVCAPQAEAAVVYFRDLVLGVDAMAQAIPLSLADQGQPPTAFTVTADQNVFAAQVALLNPMNPNDKVVFFDQNFPVTTYPAATAALNAFVAAGGRAIVTGWFAGDSAFFGPFGATFTGPTNNTSFTLEPGVYGGPLAAGGVFPLLNPGWGVFSRQLTPNPGVGGDSVAQFIPPGGDTASAIVHGNEGRTIVNGFLGDTFMTTAQGVELYRAQLNFIKGGPVGAVPEPASWALLGFGVVGLASYLRVRRRAA
jgi:hypothetical protein